MQKRTRSLQKEKFHTRFHENSQSVREKNPASQTEDFRQSFYYSIPSLELKDFIIFHPDKITPRKKVSQNFREIFCSLSEIFHFVSVKLSASPRVQNFQKSGRRKTPESPQRGDAQFLSRLRSSLFAHPDFFPTHV